MFSFAFPSLPFCSFFRMAGFMGLHRGLAGLRRGFAGLRRGLAGLHRSFVFFCCFFLFSFCPLETSFPLPNLLGSRSRHASLSVSDNECKFDRVCG